MRIAIAGATGVAGTAVIAAAGAAGHDVVEISRTRGVDLVTGLGIEEKLYQVDAVIEVTNTASQDEAQFHDFAAQMVDWARDGGWRRLRRYS